MTISKLCSVTKKAKKLHIIKNGETQWAGDGNAYYALFGMPEFTPETMLAAFGVEEKERDLWFCSIEDKLEKINIDEFCENEEPVSMDMDNYIVRDGVELLPLKCADNTFFVQRMYVKQIKMSETTEMLYRKTGNLYYFVIKEGMFPIAMIMPMKVGEKTKEWLESVLKGF